MQSIWPIIMLAASNVFMTFAWYGHLKTLAQKPVFYAIVISWGIAFFEYTLQVPANRLGHKTWSVEQLKILQEVITLSVFIPFSLYFLKEKISLNYVFGSLCILLAAWFIFYRPFDS